MNKNDPFSIFELINALPPINSYHSPSSVIFRALNMCSHSIFKNSTFASSEIKPENMGEFGDLIFPYVQMGAVSSLDIFSSLNELIIFAYYIKNKHRYKKAVDIGANIGLHSILMGKLGWTVIAYEPDPLHLELLKRNIDLNRMRNIEIVEAAVSDKAGQASFIRVVGNTTSSHIAGSKDSAYGDLETINVKLADIAEITSGVDFVKIDAEGHEAKIICGIPRNTFTHLDVMVEVGTHSNAEDIYKYSNEIGVNLYSQKNGWRKVTAMANMPWNYKEGSLFISSADRMFW